MILVDTSAFFALADRDDLHHREAKEALVVGTTSPQDVTVVLAR